MQAPIRIDRPEGIEQDLQTGAFDETGIQKNDLFQTPVPGPPHFLNDPIQGKGSESWGLLRVVTIGTPVDATPHCFQP